MKMLLKDGKRKVLTLSYDDGVIYDKHLMEIIDKYGIKCTFNINSGCYDDNGEAGSWNRRFTREEAIKLYKDSGHEVAVHTLTHPHLEHMDSSGVIYEVTKDRENLENEFGTIVRGMAYPFGTYNSEVVNVLKMCKIAYARTVKSTSRFELPENWLTLDPTCHHKNPELMNLAKRFIENKSKAGVLMFYLWGHSYEFEDDNNWEVIEEFAEYMGRREDVWYATNIEIYDYIQAFNRLETSYDKKIIHNPTDIDVWVEIDHKTVLVKAGETVML